MISLWFGNWDHDLSGAVASCLERKFWTELELTTVLDRQLGPWPFWSCSVMSWKEIWGWTDNFLGSGSWDNFFCFCFCEFLSRWGFCDFYFLERRDWVHLTMPYALPQHFFWILNGSCMGLSWVVLVWVFLEWFLSGSWRDLRETDTWNVPDLFSWMGLEGTWGELILEMEWILKCPWFIFLNGSWRDLRGMDTWNVPDLFSLKGNWGVLNLFVYQFKPHCYKPLV